MASRYDPEGGQRLGRLGYTRDVCLFPSRWAGEAHLFTGGVWKPSSRERDPTWVDVGRAAAGR